VTYWVGEAMEATDYQDLPADPENPASPTATAARNARFTSPAFWPRRRIPARVVEATVDCSAIGYYQRSMTTRRKDADEHDGNRCHDRD
jgi:hypothetical protein